MDTALSEEQALLKSSMRELLDREVTFDRIRDLEATSRFDHALWRSLQRLGWLGLPFPQSLGGGDGSLVDLAIVVEELAGHAAMVPFADVAACGLTLHRHAEPEVARREISPIIADGAVMLPAVLDESDSWDQLTTESQDGAGGNGAVSGRRLFVDYGQVASSFLVRSSVHQHTSLRIVRNEPPSVAGTSLRNIARTPSTAIELHHAPAQEVTDAGGYEFLLLLMRTLSAVQCLGSAQTAMDKAVEYVKNRVQFGRPIGSFQAVQHHCANMAILMHGARFLVYEAAWALDRGTASAEQVAMAKAWASDAAVEVTALAHQLHGGIGVTEEYDLHFFSRRAKERSVAWGTSDECLKVVSQSVSSSVDWL